MGPFEPIAAAPQSRLRGLFFGPSELRAGWRLLIFLALVTAIIVVANPVADTVFGNSGWLAARFSRKLVNVMAFVGASLIMGKVEHRTLSEYGLPRNRLAAQRFTQGVLIGTAAVGLLVGLMAASGGFRIDSVALHGDQIWKWAALYALAFALAAFEEEFRFRGYAFFTLTKGVGFWPAALFTSVLFGVAHLSNSGETWLASMNASIGGLVFALLLRWTGNLWLPIGLHASWNWTESYIFGAVTSGESLPGRLLESSNSANVWLTGGSAGPEGSIFCTVLFIGMWLLCWVWLRKAPPGG